MKNYFSFLNIYINTFQLNHFKKPARFRGTRKKNSIKILNGLEIIHLNITQNETKLWDMCVFICCVGVC